LYCQIKRLLAFRLLYTYPASVLEKEYAHMLLRYLSIR